MVRLIDEPDVVGIERRTQVPVRRAVPYNAADLADPELSRYAGQGCPRRVECIAVVRPLERVDGRQLQPRDRGGCAGDVRARQPETRPPLSVARLVLRRE